MYGFFYSLGEQKGLFMCQNKKISNHVTVKELPESERPYEKFLKNGVSSLSDAELLAVVLKSGTREKSSLELAREILRGEKGNLLNLHHYSYEDLVGFDGIGKVKAIQLKCIAELCTRMSQTTRACDIQIKSPESIAQFYMEQMRHLDTEIMVCAFFDTKLNFLGDEKISHGSVNCAHVEPRDIFRKALQKNAVVLIVLHNHPSGDPMPSEDDFRVTDRIKSGAKIIGIEWADHIIIGDNNYFSFRENQII